MNENQLQSQIEYYRLRVPKYDELYIKADRQEELKRMSVFLAGKVKDKKVLELGCGTGYWTAVMAKSAQSVLATDFNTEMLAMAKKACPADVEFRELDYFKVSELQADYDLIYGGFIMSHIPLQLIQSWLESLRRTSKKIRFVFSDNTYVQGVSTVISEEDNFGNSYQQRIVGDGLNFLVMKNFFDEEKLNALLPDGASDIEYVESKHYWLWSFVM